MEREKKYKKERWVKLGVCGVDSGQLLIVDPCYLKEWNEDDEATKKEYLRRLYKDVNTGQIFEWTVDFDNYESEMPEYNNKTPNQLLEDKIWEKHLNEVEKSSYNPLSYIGCCKVTDGENGAGEVRCGFSEAVCFSSGFGDGVYEVWGKLVDTGDWGERILEVRVFMDYEVGSGYDQFMLEMGIDIKELEENE